jgi:mycothiol synthase
VNILLVDKGLETADASAVRALAARAEEQDGTAPLSGQTLLWLSAQASVVHALAHDAEGALVGYAQVDVGGDEPSAELVVDPDLRRRGYGSALLDAVAQVAHDRPAAEGKHAAPSHGAYSVWAHGNLPEAREFAASRGLEPARELWVMSRDVTPAVGTVVPGGGAPVEPATEAEVEYPDLPDGTRLRAFEVGRDELAWLDVNARAFAGHPEQGRLTRDDLQARIEQPWFRAEDLLLLEDAGSGALAGFVWVKVVDETGGELYVVGVDPDSQGRGYGHLLTAVGLAHVAARGLPRAFLYVDADNVPAVTTYLRAGFETTARSVRMRSTRA